MSGRKTEDLQSTSQCFLNRVVPDMFVLLWYGAEAVFTQNF